AQAAWLDGVLAGNPGEWAIVAIHQPMFSPRQDRDNALLREHILPVLERHRVDLVLQGHDHVYGRRGGLAAGQGTPQYVVSVAGVLEYEARTATGRLYDAFALVGGRDAGRRLVERSDGRIAPRDCPREATPKGRTDRCWE